MTQTLITFPPHNGTSTSRSAAIAVHCMDIPLSNAGCDEMFDLAGRIIEEHK